MNHRVTIGVTVIALLTAASVALAGPILKPRKYHGPIPRSTFSIGVGFLGGASNEEMFNYFDTQVPEPVRDETQSNDFGNAPLIQLTYTYKAHPQVAVRGNAYAAYLKSDWKGILVLNEEPPDTATARWLQPTVDVARTFDVLLFALEASALYYFTDAAVKEFQPYIGGGFSMGLPYQKFTSDATILDPDSDPGYTDPTNPYVPKYTQGQPLSTLEKDQVTFEAGVHGILGMMYYFGNKWAFLVEGRLQIMQSKFPLTVLNEDNEPEEVKFDVDYSGFILVAGLSYAF
jgi:hypothetical protein